MADHDGHSEDFPPFENLNIYYERKDAIKRALSELKYLVDELAPCFEKRLLPPPHLEERVAHRNAATELIPMLEAELAHIEFIFIRDLAKMYRIPSPRATAAVTPN
jgi:hypothetical protein